MVDAQTPKGSCVIYDYPIFALNADPLNPSGSGCPALVDPFGMWLTRDNGQPPPGQPPLPPTFTAAWKSWFNQADYVVLSVPLSDYIPWTPALVRDFDEHFHLVASQPRVFCVQA